MKATGAGAGGCLVILCPPSKRTAVIQAVERAGASMLETEFDFEGVTTWEEGDAGDDTG
jgi:galactokinase/mevalonate kinase-like predicted kinase